MATIGSANAVDANSAARSRYNLILLTVAGLGGLLYGIDVGIIGGALPYLEATSGFSPAQLSIIVAAVLLGSVFSTLFSGLLADWIGRRPLMVLSGLTFASSIPIIAFSHAYWPLFFGRLLQGVSAGLVGVVVPLYLAECLSAQVRGKGTAMFQWMLTLGILVAALVGIYFSYRIRAVEHIADAATLFRFEDLAWRRIFWVSLPPGLVFVFGALLVSESPRWLFRHGRREKALVALLRSRTPQQAALELEEMEAIAQAAATAQRTRMRDSLLRRKYVIPFLLACVILFCNTATGVNSIIGYNTGILIQSGLSDLAAHWGYVLFTLVNFLATSIGMALVDLKGRRFLLIVGTSGVLVSLIGVGLLFRSTEIFTVDCRAAVQQLVAGRDSVTLRFSRMKRSNCSPMQATVRAPSIPIAPHWPSSTPAATTRRQPALCAPTTPQLRPFRSPAPTACPPTASKPSSRIPWATSRPRNPHPSKSTRPFSARFPALTMAGSSRSAFTCS